MGLKDSIRVCCAPAAVPVGTAKVSLAEGPSLQVLQRHSLLLTAVGGWLTSGAWEAEVKAH